MSINTANLSHYHPTSPQYTIADYADLLQQTRPQPPHPMPFSARAAQFSPYAALVGHKDLIQDLESASILETPEIIPDDNQITNKEYPIF